MNPPARPLRSEKMIREYFIELSFLFEGDYLLNSAPAVQPFNLNTRLSSASFSRGKMHVFFILVAVAISPFEAN
jgi:hypothetical protein